LYCDQTRDFAQYDRIRPVETASGIVEAWRVNQEELPAIKAHINESRFLCAYSGKTSFVIRRIFQVQELYIHESSLADSLQVPGAIELMKWLFPAPV